MAKFKGPDTRAMLEAGRSGGEFAYRGEKARGDQEKEKAAAIERGFSRAGQHVERQQFKNKDLAARKERLTAEMGMAERKQKLAEAKEGYQWNQGERPPPGEAGQPAPGQPAPGQPQPGQPQPGQPDSVIAEGQGGPREPGAEGAGPGVAEAAPPPETNPSMLKQDLSYQQGQGYLTMRPEEKAKRAGVATKRRADIHVALSNARSKALDSITKANRLKYTVGDDARKAEVAELAEANKQINIIQDKINAVGEGKMPTEELVRMYADNPEVQKALGQGMDEDTKQQATDAAGEQGVPGPGDEKALPVIMRLMKADRDTVALNFIATSGVIPQAWDESGDIGRRFTSLMPRIRMAMSSGMGQIPGDVKAGLQAEYGEEQQDITASWKGLKNDSEQQRFARKTLARLMVEGAERQMAGDQMMEMAGTNQQNAQLQQTVQNYIQQFGITPEQLQQQIDSGGEGGQLPGSTGTDTTPTRAEEPGGAGLQHQAGEEYRKSGGTKGIPSTWKGAK